MIAPIVIETLFMAACLVAFASAFFAIGKGASVHRPGEIIVGFAILILGPFVARLYCEVFIVVFRINDSLTDIRELAMWAAERSHALGIENGEDGE
jgi:hypothetical protein